MRHHVASQSSTHAGAVPHSSADTSPSHVAPGGSSRLIRPVTNASKACMRADVTRSMRGFSNVRGTLHQSAHQVRSPARTGTRGDRTYPLSQPRFAHHRLIDEALTFRRLGSRYSLPAAVASARAARRSRYASAPAPVQLRPAHAQASRRTSNIHIATAWSSLRVSAVPRSWLSKIASSSSSACTIRTRQRTDMHTPIRTHANQPVAL